jgi:succinoglycan biosynthesis protein ExoM
MVIRIHDRNSFFFGEGRMTSSVIPAAIDICICTFRRAHIRETIESVARQIPDLAWKVRIIVADNDDAPTAKELVEETARQNSLTLVYRHAPARNISRARNACLDLAVAPFIAFIDDDEIAGPAWLRTLMETQKETGADAVLGPVIAVYRPECPGWLKKSDFHSSLPVWKNGSIVSGGAGNVLLNRSSVSALRFREDLGRCGGEDTAYFHQLTAMGGRIAFAKDAIATEVVPKERESFAWLLKRRFRYGQTHGLLLAESMKNKGRVKNIFIAALKALFCAAMALLGTLKERSMRFWSLRAALHAGVTWQLMGFKTNKQGGPLVT